MATQKVVRAIQKVRQEDGTYLPVLPINTSDEVYTDIANKKTLRQELGEMIYKQNTITGNNMSISTFRDPAAFIGPEGAVNGDINIELPINGGTSGTNVSIDLSISGADHVVMETKNGLRIDSFPGTPGPVGESIVHCSEMSAHGNVLVMHGGGDTYGVKAYSVHDNELSEIRLDGVFAGNVTKCSVSENGHFVALMDSTHIHTFFKLSDTMYYQTGSVAVANIANVASIKVIDPDRTVVDFSGMYSRTAYVVVCYTSSAPIVYSFAAFVPPSQNTVAVKITDVVSDIEVDSNAQTLYCRTNVSSQSIAIYKYNASTRAYSRTSAVNYGSVLLDSSISPSGTYITNVFTASNVRVYSIPDGGIPSTTAVKTITVPSGLLVTNCKMITDRKIIMWGRQSSGSTVGAIGLYNLDTDSWVDVGLLSEYIGGIPNNIVSSANRKYGFIIKGSSVVDATPMILPFEHSVLDIRPSAGMNELEAISTRFVAMSNDGKYVALVPKNITGTTKIRIFKEINNSYMDITPATFTSVTEANVVALECTENGDTFALVTTTTAHVYRRNALDIFTEYAVPNAGTGTNTCATISEPFNGNYLLFIGKASAPFVGAYFLSSTENLTITQRTSDVVPSGAITTKVIGIKAYKQTNVYIATAASNNSQYNITIYGIGGNTILDDNIVINSEPIDGAGAKIEFSISRNGEYIVPIDKTNNAGTFYCRNGSKDLVEMGFSDNSFTELKDAVFDHNGRFLYILNEDNSIICYDIRDGEDSTIKNITELTTYTNTSMTGLNKLLLVDTDSYSRLFVNGYAFPYFFIFDVNVVSGFADVNLSGTLISESRTDSNGFPYVATLWKNVNLTHNNPTLISEIEVGTEANGVNGMIVIKSFDEKWIRHAVKINRLSIYGVLEDGTDYTDISISNYYSNPGTIKDIQIVQNSIGVYRDMNIIGTGTINGDQIVGVKRLKNISISKDLWIDEKTTTGSGYYRYRIDDRHISADSMVNMDIKTPADLTIASAAGLQSITVEGDGYVDIYATTIPTANIVVDVNIFR